MTSTRRPSVTLAAALVLASAAACDQVPDNALQSCEQSQPFLGHVSTDILFVIDDSPSMDPFQQRLRLALSRFINTLSTSPVANDFRIGVTTTSVADYNGPLYAYYPNSSPSPGTPYPRGIITAINGAVDPNNTATWGWFLWSNVQGFYGTRILDSTSPTIVQDFEHNVLVGDWGAGREQPFEAMRLALSDQIASGKQNYDFLRPGARLAIVFLSDEDDCSGPTDGAIQSNQDCQNARTSPSTLVPVSTYASFLQGPVGGEVRDTVVAAIVGATCSGGLCDVNTVCTNGSTHATTTPLRIAQLLGNFDSTRTRLASICDDNFDAALDAFAEAIMSQTVPLEGAPADWRLLVASVTRNGTTIPCTIASFDDPANVVDAADAVYEPPQEGSPATLTFQQDCKLQPGDQIDVRVVCAG